MENTRQGFANQCQTQTVAVPPSIPTHTDRMGYHFLKKYRKSSFSIPHKQVKKTGEHRAFK
jgi:hypothetical protein